MCPLKYSYECDLIEVTQAGIFHEYEVKVSRSDFFADFQKNSAWNWRPEKKHEIISDGIGPNYFSFVTPAGLVKIYEVPEYAGLIEVNEDGKVVYTKVPLRLHKNKIEPDVLLNLAQKLSFKFYNSTANGRG